MEINLTTLSCGLRYGGLKGCGILVPRLSIGYVPTKTGEPVDVNFGTGGVEEMIKVEPDYHRLSQLEEAKRLVTPEVEDGVVEKLRQFAYTYPDLSQTLIDEHVSMDFYIVWSYS